MAEQTQTEKLREEMEGIVSDMVYGLTAPHFSNEIVGKILQACQEAGLKFTQTGVVGSNLEGAYLCQVEEIEI